MKFHIKSFFFDVVAIKFHILWAKLLFQPLSDQLNTAIPNVLDYNRTDRHKAEFPEGEWCPTSKHTSFSSTALAFGANPHSRLAPKDPARTEVRVQSQPEALIAFNGLPLLHQN